MAHSAFVRRATVRYVAGLLLFGLNGIVSSHIALSSYDIVFFRTLLGSVFLLAVCGVSHTSRLLKAHPKQTVMVLFSGVSMGLSWIFLYEAYRRIGVALSSVTYYCGPVLVMLASPLVFRQKLDRKKIFCFVAVFLGVLCVSLPGVLGSGCLDRFGLLCGFASSVAHAAMVLFTLKAPDITGVQNSAFQLTASFCTVAVFLAAGQTLALPAGTQQWFWVFVLGFLNTGVGCWLYFSQIALLPVATVSILGYLEPLSAVVFSALLLRERLTFPELLGVVLILGGAVGSELPDCFGD